MTNISKSPLDKVQEQKLFEQLGNLISQKTPQETNFLLAELLGEEEKIMLAKRLAIIVLLYRKQTLYFIAHSLHVSPATVSRIAALLNTGRYKLICKSFDSRTKKVLDMLEAIDSILHLGGLLPHYGMTPNMEDYKDYQELKRKKKSL